MKESREREIDPKESGKGKRNSWICKERRKRKEKEEKKKQI